MQINNFLKIKIQNFRVTTIDKFRIIRILDNISKLINHNISHFHIDVIWDNI